MFDLASQLNSYEIEIVPIIFQGNHIGKGKSYPSCQLRGKGKGLTLTKSDMLPNDKDYSDKTGGKDNSVSTSVTCRHGCKRKKTLVRMR